MSKKKMTSKASHRIQSHKYRTGRNQSFKSRVMRAASKKMKQDKDLREYPSLIFFTVIKERWFRCPFPLEENFL